MGPLILLAAFVVCGLAVYAVFRPLPGMKSRKDYTALYMRAVERCRAAGGLKL